jgi:hypothetical protein
MMMKKLAGFMAAGIFGACIILFVLRVPAWIDGLDKGVVAQHRTQLSQIIVEVGQ